MTTLPRYEAAALVAAASRPFVSGGLPPDRARAVAEVLVEGDLLGQTMHGVNPHPAIPPVLAARCAAAGFAAPSPIDR